MGKWKLRSTTLMFLENFSAMGRKTFGESKNLTKTDNKSTEH